MCGEGPSPGPTGGRSWGNGNPGLYYKSRPEGTWGSPHDTSPTRLPVSVPSDAGLSSKASKVRGSHRCYGTARCTAASEKVHLSRQGLGLILVAGHGSFGAAPLSIILIGKVFPEVRILQVGPELQVLPGLLHLTLLRRTIHPGHRTIPYLGSISGLSGAIQSQCSARARLIIKRRPDSSRSQAGRLRVVSSHAQAKGRTSEEG